MADDKGAAVPLPPASVDFNALNDALRAGKSPDDARAAAIDESTLALSVDEAAVRAATARAEAPDISRLDKAGLIELGESEAVTHALDKDGAVIAFADATNAQMRDAIEAKRRGEPVLPDTGPAAA